MARALEASFVAEVGAPPVEHPVASDADSSVSAAFKVVVPPRAAVAAPVAAGPAAVPTEATCLSDPEGS